MQAFLDSPHYSQKDAAHKKKCDRKDYLPRTTEKALEGLNLKAENAVRPIKDPQRERYSEPEKEPKTKKIPAFYDERGKFLHHVMGEYLTEKLGVCKIGGALHIYDNGIYREGEETIHGHMVNPVLGFLGDCGEVDGEPVQLLYEKYRRWCEKTGHTKIYSRVKFSREVLAGLPGYKTESVRHSYFEGHTGRCFVKDF